MTAETYYNEIMKPEIELFHTEMMEKLNSDEQIKKLYTGWKVWFSPILINPEILFIGINPGGGEGGDLTLEPDGILQYIFDESAGFNLKDDINEVFNEKELFDLVDLAYCVKTNYYYLATKNSDEIKKIGDFLGREKDKSGLGDKFFQNSKKWSNQILDIIKPNLIICEGKTAFILLTQFALELKKIETNGQDVFTFYCEKLNATIIMFERLRSGAIKNKAMLKKVLIEHFTS